MLERWRVASLRGSGVSTSAMLPEELPWSHVTCRACPQQSALAAGIEIVS